MSTYFRTYTGKKIFPSHLEDMDVCIEDIAHSLSMVNRYNGHLDVAYSVASHSLLVERVSGKGLPALLHDAGECYLPDFPSPWKQCFPNIFGEIIEKLDRIIFAHFGIDYPLSPYIKEVDVKLRTDEMFFLSSWKDCNTVEYAFSHGIINELCKETSPCEVEERFLQRFEELK